MIEEMTLVLPISPIVNKAYLQVQQIIMASNQEINNSSLFQNPRSLPSFNL